MDTIYLLPGEERCVDFRDVNGVPKVRYTCSHFAFSLRRSLPLLKLMCNLKIFDKS